MSLLSQIFSGLSDKDGTESVIHPCRNCESDCSVYPDACEACKPYKEKLVDALYNVEHIDAFYDKYEIVSADATPVGTTVCPYCGAPAAGAVCEFCGSRIAESNGKIQVTSANDIPDPIIEARDIIYGRRAVIDRYTGESESGSSGILGSIVSALTNSDTDRESSLGSAMTESEIKAMAEKYGVSVRDYLEGLDTGTYLSKTAYEKKQSSAAYTTAAAAGTPFGGSRPPRPQNGYPQPRPNGAERPHGGRPPMGDHSQPRRGADPRQSGSRPMQQGNRAPDHGFHGGSRPDAGHGGGPRGGGRNGRGR